MSIEEEITAGIVEGDRLLASVATFKERLDRLEAELNNLLEVI